MGFPFYRPLMKATSINRAPYEDIVKEEYTDMCKSFPREIDWKSVKEEIDTTTASQEAACTADACEI